MVGDGDSLGTGRWRWKRWFSHGLLVVSVRMLINGEGEQEVQ